MLLIGCGSCSTDNFDDITPVGESQTATADTTTVAPSFDESALAEDNISETNFDRTIKIVYADGGAQVSGDENGIVAVSGNHVTVNNTSNEKVVFELSGTAADGSLKLYNQKKQALILNNLDLTNTQGAAINNQGKKRCFVVVKGANALKDAATYSTPDGEDEKAAIFSEGQLIFSGDGALSVTAQGKSGITSDDYVHFMGTPTVTVSSSAGHGVRGKDAVIVSGGTINVSVSANMKKGIASDSLVCINGGTTVINVTGSAV